MNIEDIKARHEASQQSTDIPANEEFWQCLEDRGELIRIVELLEGALEFERERANGLGEELDRLEKWQKYHEEISKNRVDMESQLRAEVEQHELKAKWCCCSSCFDRIQELDMNLNAALRENYEP